MTETTRDVERIAEIPEWERCLRLALVATESGSQGPEAMKGNVVVSRSDLESAWVEIRRLRSELEVKEAEKKQLRLALEETRRLAIEAETALERMDAVLREAAEWFREYAASHTAKGKPEKAQRNRERMEHCLRALATGGDAAPKTVAIVDHGKSALQKLAELSATTEPEEARDE